MKKQHKPVQIAIILIFVFSLLGPAAPTAGADAPARLHPVLTELAAEAPNQTVSVIVRKGDRSDQAEAFVTGHGGRITKDLSMIQSFAAELPAGLLPDLARLAAVSWVSLDAPVKQVNCPECVNTANLVSAYGRAIGADQLWNQSPYLQGQGITVAVVDSGIDTHDDLGTSNGSSRIKQSVYFSSSTSSTKDQYGHGTHIAGIIAGNGSLSYGYYMGVAPKVNLINVKVSNDIGAGLTSDVVAGLQWVYNNKQAYNIRIVNLSLNSSVPESYHTSALDAAVEILWFNGIVVVVSAGNNGLVNNGILYPPANDPFVITVGAMDDRGTASLSDDQLASFSAYGITQEGFAKPELVAPGKNIISLKPTRRNQLYIDHPSHRVSGPMNGPDHYFRMSGTSMASAVATGAVALLLQDEPNLTPDQVKARLMATTQPVTGAPPGSTGAGYLDIYAAVNGSTTASANTGILASQLLWTGSQPVSWNSVSWNSVSWNSVSWNSVSWNSVSWNSVSWNSDFWED